MVESARHFDPFGTARDQFLQDAGFRGRRLGLERDGLCSRTEISSAREADTQDWIGRPIEADVVLAPGSRLGPFGTLPQHGMDYWPKSAKIIQVDADHTTLGLVKKISVGICGDAGASAKALTARLADRTLTCDATRDARAAEMQKEKAD